MGTNSRGSSMDKPKIYVIIPWREQPSRIKPFKEVMKWFQDNLPYAVITTVDSPYEFWSMSAVRNIGVRFAEEHGADIVIINDADTIPELPILLEAVEAAMSDDFIHNPYDMAKFYGEEATRKYFDGISLDKLPFMPMYPNGGAYVFKPSSWWLLGGNDEKFKKWGYEDNAFNYVHEIIHGKEIVKHKGSITLFNHEVQDHPATPSLQLKVNMYLYSKYLTIKDPEELLKFVESEL